jgi:hypothetical protein
MTPNPVPEVPDSVQKKFWERVVRSNETTCWEFIKGRDGTGYGLVYFSHEKHRAHRVAWRIVFGAIPELLNVLHRCDNRCCCNPFHLHLGTHADNMRDMALKGRGTRGRRCFTNKLAASQVLKIRSEYDREKNGYAALGRQYGVHPTNIEAIISRRTWNYI